MVKVAVFVGTGALVADQSDAAGRDVCCVCAAKSATVRAAATDLLTGHPQRAVIVLGDLNDDVEAATAQILNGPPGSEIGTTGVDRPDTADAQRLWNLAPRMPAAQR